MYKPLLGHRLSGKSYRISQRSFVLLIVRAETRNGSYTKRCSAFEKPMNREIKICSECESEYFKESSEMTDLCPDCAHQLYNYSNCKHKFENGNCSKCGWNGKTSEYLKNRKE